MRVKVMGLIQLQCTQSWQRVGLGQQNSKIQRVESGHGV